MLATQLAILVVSLSQSFYIKYETVTGYFLQDDIATNATSFDYTRTNFGLINRSYQADVDARSASLTQWQRFANEVDRLNHDASSNVKYKVLFMGRHGEGYHNVAEADYGTPAWNCYWSLLNGNGSITWDDAELTPTGIAQAREVNRFWQHQISKQKMPTPQSFYVSPLQRCLATANESFFGLDLPTEHPFSPIIKEGFREGISLHTCDHRHSRTYIANKYPNYGFELSFTEHDELWSNKNSETSVAQDQRSKQALDDLFNSDSSTYISITSHSGEIASILRVLGHRKFSLRIGTVIPVLVRAEMIHQGTSPSTTSRITSRTVSTHCTEPPVTSISDGPFGGCVCPSGKPPVTSPLMTMSVMRRYGNDA